MRSQEANEGGQGQGQSPVRASWEMTLDELEGTAWAREFKADSPVSYPEALTYARCEDLRVYVRKTDEAGEVLWVIVVVDEGGSGDFWMDAKPTKKDAIALCRRMRWKVTS